MCRAPWRRCLRRSRERSSPASTLGFIIDTAHDLVDLILARADLDTGDLDLARSAATTAQTVDPDRTSDRPFTDLMRIAHAAGDLDEMRTHAELLLAERDFEIGEDLPPGSFAVFNELFPPRPPPPRLDPDACRGRPIVDLQVLHRLQRWS